MSAKHAYIYLHFGLVNAYYFLLIHILTNKPNAKNREKYINLFTFFNIAGIEVSRTPKGFPEQLAIVLTYQCKLFLNNIKALYCIKYLNKSSVLADQIKATKFLLVFIRV